MRKKCTKVVMLVCALCLLFGCGGKTEENTPEPVKEISLDQGYWVAEAMVMEGSEFSGEDLEGIFGPADAVLSLGFNADGKVDGILFEEFITGTYTGTLNEFTVDIAGEKMTGSYSEDKMTLILGEDSSFTLVNQKEMPNAMANNAWATYDVNFSSEDTCAMSNFMNYGRYFIEDDVIYGLTHVNSLDGQFGATPFYMKGDFPEFEETTILDPDGTAINICKYEDYFYYLRDWAQVCRVHIDGSGLEVLFDGSCDYLQIHDGKLYFTNEDYQFVSMDLDGSNMKTIIDKEVYYPYFICSDWMIFQDDADDESLHLYNISHETELNITYMPSYNPIIDGKYLYFAARGENGFYICKIDMSDPDRFPCEASEEIIMTTSFLIDETYIYTSNSTSYAKEDWKKLSDTREYSYENEYYVSEKYTIHHEFDDEGMIVAKYLMSKERHGGNPFR